MYRLPTTVTSIELNRGTGHLRDRSTAEITLDNGNYIPAFTDPVLSFESGHGLNDRCTVKFDIYLPPHLVESAIGYIRVLMMKKKFFTVGFHCRQGGFTVDHCLIQRIESKCSTDELPQVVVSIWAFPCTLPSFLEGE
jgi:hypothetical protein